MTESYQFTNARGAAILLDPPHYRVRKIEGVGAPPTVLLMQKAPYQQGQTLLDQSLEPRPVFLDVICQGTDRATTLLYRHDLQAAFNVALGNGVLQWTRDDGTVYCLAAAPDGVDFPAGQQNSGYTYQVATINLKCPSPCWYGSIRSSQNNVAYKLGFALPFVFPVSFANIVGVSGINNLGDVPTPPYFEIYGPATNPKITNATSGKYLELTYAIAAGDRVEIDSAFGAKRIEYVTVAGVRTNIFGYLTAASEFFDLDVGVNAISYYETGYGSGAGSMIVHWYNRFIGL